MSTANELGEAGAELDRIRRELRRLRKEVERVLFLNGLAYGSVIAILATQLARRIFRP